MFTLGARDGQKDPPPTRPQTTEIFSSSFPVSSTSNLGWARQGLGLHPTGTRGHLRVWPSAGLIMVDRWSMGLRWAQEVGWLGLPVAAAAHSQACLSPACPTHSVEPDRPRWSGQGKQRFPTSPLLDRDRREFQGKPRHISHWLRGGSCQDTHGLPLPALEARTLCSPCPHAVPLRWVWT